METPQTHTGIGRTLQRAIEHAVSSAKLPPPLRFEVLDIAGMVTTEPVLWYEVRVRVRSEFPESAPETLEDTATRRSVGTGEVLS